MLRAIVLLLGLSLPALAQDGPLVTLPPGDARAAPIVLVLHGGGGSGAQIRATSGFDALARQAGVVAVYPDAPRRIWSDGRNPRQTRDDVATLLAMVDALAARGIGDARRLFVIGHSNGGGMAMRLACAAPERLAGLAVVATKTLLDAPCENPRAPLPALFLHGTADTLAPHHGRRRSDPDRRIARLAWLLGEEASAAETAALWAARNRCRPSAPRVRSDPVAGDGVSLVTHDFAGCAAPLRWVELIGAGHAWPGAAPVRRLREEPLVRDLDAGQAALEFWGLSP